MVHKIACLITLLFLIGCNSGSSNGSPVQPEMVGYWVDPDEVNYLKVMFNNGNKECATNHVPSSGAGKHYLDGYKIEAGGKVLQLATITKSSSQLGDFSLYGKINSSGRLILNSFLLEQLKLSGVYFKNYEHTLSVSESTLTYTIQYQEVELEGKTWTMNNNKTEFVKVDESELSTIIRYAKNCIDHQKIVD